VTHQTSELRYAVRFAVIAKYIGQLSLVLMALTLVPCLVALSLGEVSHSLDYLPPLLLLLLCWMFTYRLPSPAAVQANEGMIVVSLFFLLTSLLMSYPLMLAGLDFEDALFETISAITTTGLSTQSTLAAYPPSLLFTRSWMQWYGGMGIAVLSLALLIQPGLVAKGLAIQESEADDLVGGVRAHARRILMVYVGLTLVGILINWLFGLGWFKGVLYALSAVSTGGFAPSDGGLASLSILGQWSVTLLCLVGAIPLTFYYLRGYSQHTQLAGNRLQVWALFGMMLLVTLILGLCLRQEGGFSWSQVLHHAPLLAASAQTTAGFSSIPIQDLPAAGKLVLILAMLSGGGIASTAGGCKLLRLLILFSLLRAYLIRCSLPRHAVLEPGLAGRNLEGPEIMGALLIILLFIGVVILSWLPFVWLGYPPLDSLFEVVSATGTVGLSSGITSVELPSLLKAVLCMDMLMGRLEILAWLVLLYPGSWFGRRRVME
jgi:trk system potassium uptake protein